MLKARRAALPAAAATSGDRSRPRFKRYAVHGVIVATMVAGVSAFVSFDKTVELTIDGQTSEVGTFAGTVGGVLAREGIEITEHDTVVPTLDRKISEGQRIAVRFGRPIDLDVDGSSRQVWVTATSVNEALGQLGLRDENMYVSASRSAPIGRDGLDLRILTPRDVTVVADGKTRELSTVATTVRQVLLEAGIALDPQDEVNPQLQAAPEDGSTIRVVRIDQRRITVKVDIPFKVREIKDRKMFKGEEKVVKKGKKGVKQLTVDLLKRDGRVSEKDTVAQRVLRAPVTQVVRVGTRKNPRSVSGGADNMNWAALADCESGGDPNAVNSAGPYYGLYQFDTQTWRSVGGSGVPSDASKEEQTYRAKLLFKDRGSSPWPVCGGNLYD